MFLCDAFFMLKGVYMSTFDAAAEQAFYSEKKTSADFRARAKKNAYALFLFAIISAGIGVSFNGIWILLPIALMIFSAFQVVSSRKIATKIECLEEIAAAAQKEKVNAEEERFKAIIKSYGELLKTSAPLPGKVSDETKLPHKKRIIKEAIIWALLHYQDDRNKEQLKLAFAGLARWQHGVGDKDQDLHASVGEGTLDVALLAGSKEKPAEKKDWNTLVQVETETLKRELKDADIR